MSSGKKQSSKKRNSQSSYGKTVSPKSTVPSGVKQNSLLKKIAITAICVILALAMTIPSLVMLLRGSGA